jgi:hypothetical protein
MELFAAFVTLLLLDDNRLSNQGQGITLGFGVALDFAGAIS